MSQENVEVVRRAFDAYNRRDRDTLQALNHPDIEIDWSASIGPEPRIYRGREQAADFYDNFLDIFERVQLVPERFIEAGDAVVAPNSAERGAATAYRRWLEALSSMRFEVAESFACVSTRRPLMPSKPSGCGSRAMSQENVELARRHYAILNAAFESGDLRALERHNAEFLDPDFVCKPAPVFDDTEEMHGHEGALRYTRALMEPFAAVWVQPQEFIESEDRLVVPIRFRGRARYTSIDVDLDRWHVWTFRSGTVLRLDVYARKSEALEAVGLRD